MEEADLFPAEHYIEIPATVDLVALVKKAYDLSSPQGMGFLHFTPDPLTDDEAKFYVPRPGRVNSDYIKGRAVKFNTIPHEGKVYAPRDWYDHSPAQYRELLASVGVTL